MNLFSELLLASDHPDARRFDASESQPVPADDCFQRLHNHVTNAGIQVESGKDPFVQVNRMARSLSGIDSAEAPNMSPDVCTGFDIGGGMVRKRTLWGPWKSCCKTGKPRSERFASRFPGGHPNGEERKEVIA